MQNRRYSSNLNLYITTPMSWHSWAEKQQNLPVPGPSCQNVLEWKLSKEYTVAVTSKLVDPCYTHWQEYKLVELGHYSGIYAFFLVETMPQRGLCFRCIHSTPDACSLAASFTTRLSCRRQLLVNLMSLVTLSVTFLKDLFFFHILHPYCILLPFLFPDPLSSSLPHIHSSSFRKGWTSQEY